MPAVLTLMLLPLAFVLHLIVPLQPVALKVALSPLHKLFLFDEITGAAGLLPVVITTTLLAPLSPQLLLQLAV